MKEKTEKQYRKINGSKNPFFGKINKTDKLLVNLIRKKKEEKRYKLPRSELRRYVTTNPTDINIMIREYDEQLYGNKFNDLKWTNSFKTQQRLLEKKDNWNTLIKESGFVVKNLSQRKPLAQVASLVQSIKHLRKM